MFHRTPINQPVTSRRTAQTSVLRLLRRVVGRGAADSPATDRPGQQSRRQFIRQLSPATAGTALSGHFFACRSTRQPTLAIVGAGMAGLTMAYHLERVGLRAELFESDSRVGGWVRSAPNLLANGIVTELPGGRGWAATNRRCR